MPYTALPDRRLPYHRDGTVVAAGTAAADSAAARFAAGLTSYISGTDLIILNGFSGAAVAGNYTGQGRLLHNSGAGFHALWCFFPERREISAMLVADVSSTTAAGAAWFAQAQGSADTTNGVDGTWETASFPSGLPSSPSGLDGWRANIKPLSLTGSVRAIRFATSSAPGSPLNPVDTRLIHLYGEKAAGQTPDDLIFIDHDTTPGVEYTAPEDFGDRPLGTSVVRQFRVKNASPTLTANSINLQLNDSDFTISTDGTTWVVTINIASLAAGAESATLYVRNTTPAPGALLGPRFAEIVAIVGSWS